MAVPILRELQIQSGAVYALTDLPNAAPVIELAVDQASSVAVPQALTAARAARSRRLAGVNSIAP